MDNLGAILGPLLALGLVAVFSVRTAILISVIPGLLAAVAIIYAIRHAKLPTTRAASAAHPGTRSRASDSRSTSRSVLIGAGGQATGPRSAVRAG